MQITIDTNKDSKNDLKKLILFLNSIIDEKNLEKSDVEINESSNNNQEGMFSMFEENNSEVKNEKKFNDDKEMKFTIVPY
jgi:hypothetical protein